MQGNRFIIQSTVLASYGASGTKAWVTWPSPTRAVAAEIYYEIDITGEGTLFVPMRRAQMVGLRRLSNSVAVIAETLASESVGLPEDGRQRLAGLRLSEQAREAEALPCAIRDLLAVRRTSPLTNPERKWLDNVCRRLSAEAAVVDHISVAEAHAAILAVVAAAAVPARVDVAPPEESQADDCREAG